jgi:predicted ATPase/DNA-binding SARP family transcriptional activator
LCVDGSSVSSARQRRLLAALAMAHGNAVSTDRLVDVVWDGDAPPAPSNALQTYVSRLRISLGPDAVLRRPPGYALALPVDDVDAWRFEALVERARGLPAGDALDVLDEALGLWRGAAYAEFADADFARGESVRLEERRASAESARLDALLRLGRTDEVLTGSLRLIDGDPYRESAWEQRMRALHASGRTRDAVQAYQQYRTRLRDEVGLEPSAELAALERALVAGPPPTADAPALAPLPAPLTSLVGRDGARDDVAALLATGRLVTLVGPGGVGKTRLAVEVARTHRSPVSFVELAVHGPDDVTLVVARACGCPDDGDPLGAVRRRLAGVALLLVLDNCEHVVEPAAALVDGLLPFCAELRVLATSRMPLGVAGEVVWTVPSLDDAAATQLFRQRAAVDAREMSTIGAICAAVDRLPLGIELAAAAARRLPLDRVADGLVAAPGLMATTASGRHRSLDAAVAWSFQLLDDVDQVLFTRLAVFDGGWTLEAAEGVAAVDGLDQMAIAPTLSRLVAASLVTFEPALRRYGMLDTIHTFARARLAEADGADAVRQAHLRWSVELARTEGSHLVGPDPGVHASRLRIEYPNLRAALRWALDSNCHAEAAALAHALTEFWAATDAGAEAMFYVRRVLDHPAPATTERVELTVALSGILSIVGDLEGYSREATAAVAMARQLQDRHALCRSLVMGSFSGRRDWAEEALALAEELGDATLAAEALHMLGLLAHLAGDEAAAIGYYERSIAAGPASVIFGPHDMLGLAYRNLGRWADARRELLVGERDLAELGGRPVIACLELALVEISAGDREAARRAVDRAALWGRPGDDYVADGLLFDAVAALVQVEDGDLDAPAVVAARIADVPVEASGHGVACEAWLVAGEVAFRTGQPAAARQCFETVLAHPFGAMPYHRAHALAGIAGTLRGAEARPFAVEASSLRDQYGFVTPRWFTIGCFDGS